MNKTVTDQGNPYWRRSARLLVVCSLLTIIGFTLVCLSIMIDMRRGQEELARQAGENLASTIEADISRNIEIYDLSLRAAATNFASQEIDNVSRELRHLILFDHAATAKHFGAMQVFTPMGNLAIDASTLDPEPQNVADAEFFRTHRENPNAGLFISPPVIHRGVQSVVLSRRINDRDGHFHGVVAGAIRFSYFHELFGRLRLAERDTITILKPNGVVIMRTPFQAGFIGRNVSNVASRMLTEPAGNMSAKSTLDGVERLFVWQGSDKRFIVVVGKPWGVVYAMWNRQAIWIGAVVIILAALAALMAFFLAREMARRARAEESLSELATTDGLTDLSNRRKFDREIELEWRRAARSHENVALLMIDADHFKAYNDSHGHQAGDKALRAVAVCVSAFANRPGDCAARYGGEEFALLLPGVRRTEALQIANALRERVARCLDNPAPVTVSVGVAVLPADGRETPAVLIELADRALYEAKRGGRNQCCATAASSTIAA